jgi:hypothetical protein
MAKEIRMTVDDDEHEKLKEQKEGTWLDMLRKGAECND